MCFGARSPAPPSALGAESGSYAGDKRGRCVTADDGDGKADDTRRIPTTAAAAAGSDKGKADAQ